MEIAIVGGGLSGLATAYLLTRARPAWQVTLYERDREAGGRLRSETAGGYLHEWGPSGLPADARAALGLVRDLGLEAALEPAAEAARRVYLYRDGGLRPLPTSPRAFLASELVSPAGKLRAALEPFLASRPEPEETVFAFFARRFGRGVAVALAEPLVLAAAAGSAQETSMPALLPWLGRLERRHGSLLRAWFAEGAWWDRFPFGGELFGLRGGMRRLAEGLVAALGERVRTGTEVAALDPAPAGGLRLRLAGGGEALASAAVLATPAFTSAALLEPLQPTAADALAGIPYADAWLFGLGFDRIDVPRILDASGLLVPRGQGVRSLEVSWSSAVFPDRAPEGKVLLRVLAGGVLDPAFARLDPAAALAAVRRDLRLTMGITAEPEFLEQRRMPRAIPGYLRGHRRRLERASIVARDAGVLLTGGFFRGPGVDDCILDAQRVVAELTGEVV